MRRVCEAGAPPFGLTGRHAGPRALIGIAQERNMRLPIIQAQHPERDVGVILRLVDQQVMDLRSGAMKPCRSMIHEMHGASSHHIMRACAFSAAACAKSSGSACAAFA